MKALSVLCLAVLAGCAAPPPPGPRVLTPEIAQQLPAADLCLGLSTFHPMNVPTAQAEITRRGINCQDHTQAMQTILQQRAQAQSLLLQNALTRPAYQPIPMPQIDYRQIVQPRPSRSTHCTTQRIGNQLQTDCR